jgi:hypothetical protein
VTPYDHWKTTDRLAEAPDPLEGKPRGYCPWCKSTKVKDTPFDGGSLHVMFSLPKCGWDEDSTEDENRIRYAAAKLEESKLWNKIEKEGGEK